MLMSLCIGQYNVADAQGIIRRYDAWGGLQPESGFGIETTTTGYVVFLGSYYVDDTLLYTSVLTTIHLDQFGNALDTNKAFIPLKATYAGHANVAFPLSNGGFGVGSSSNDGSTGRPALFLFDPMGVSTAILEYGVSGQYWIGRQGKQCPDGGYVICGETSSSGTSLDAFLLKIDSTGAQEWVQTFGLPNKQEYMSTVDLAPGGGYYLGGQRDGSTPGMYDQWVLRVNASGGLIWEDTYGGPFHETNAGLTTLADGNIAFASAIGFGPGGVERLNLAKVDSTGALLWSYVYDGNATGSTLFVVKEVQPYGDLISAGFSYRPGYLQGALLRTNAQGDSIWMRYYNYYDSLWTEGRGAFRDVLPTADGGFIAAGTAYGSNNPNDTAIYSQDTWVVKVDSLGCLVPGCDTVTGIVSQITNYQHALSVSPNPASSSVHIAWVLPSAFTQKGAAQLSVVNSTGALVREVGIDLSGNGYDLDVSCYAPGLYHLHLVQDGTWITGGKVVVE